MVDRVSIDELPLSYETMVRLTLLLLRRNTSIYGQIALRHLSVRIDRVERIFTARPGTLLTERIAGASVVRLATGLQMSLSTLCNSLRRVSDSLLVPVQGVRMMYAIDACGVFSMESSNTYGSVGQLP